MNIEYNTIASADRAQECVIMGVKFGDNKCNKRRLISHLTGCSLHSYLSLSLSELLSLCSISLSNRASRRVVLTPIQARESPGSRHRVCVALGANELSGFPSSQCSSSSFPPLRVYQAGSAYQAGTVRIVFKASSFLGPRGVYALVCVV